MTISDYINVDENVGVSIESFIWRYWDPWQHIGRRRNWRLSLPGVTLKNASLSFGKPLCDFRLQSVVVVGADVFKIVFTLVNGIDTIKLNSMQPKNRF